MVPPIRYLIDNSVWQRAHIRVVKEQIARTIRAHAVFTCPPQALEFCYSARNADDHLIARRAMEEFTEAPLHPDLDECLDLQAALWASGRLTVLHYDRAFERIASVWPPLRHEWVATPGTLP